MVFWQIFSLIFSLLLLLSNTAQADEAEEQMQRGLRSEQSLDFSSAEAAYAKVVELRPSASFAHRARIRLEDLRAHSEGGYEPLRQLEALRRSHRASDPAELEAFWGEVQRFPSGRVRAESLLLLSEGWGPRLKLYGKSIESASKLVREQKIDRPLRVRGLEIWVDSLLSMGRREEALAVLSEFPGLAPMLERRIFVERRRDRMDRGAQVILAVFSGVLVVSIWRLRRSGARIISLVKAPTSFVVVSLLVFGGGWLTLWFDPSLSVRPFVLLGAGVWGIDRSVALGREALGQQKVRRWLLMGLGITSVMAWAYLSLRFSDPLYLASFGL